MTDIFEPVIRKLFDLGFGNVIVFFLVSAIIYAILRKSKMLGESELVNGVISVIAAFLVGFWFPIITGVTLVPSLTAFFAQSTTMLIFIVVGFLFASIFYPNMTEMLMEQFKRRTTLYTMIALALALLITSGLISTMWSLASVPKKPGESPGVSSDVSLIAAAVIIFIVILLIGGSAARMSE